MASSSVGSAAFDMGDPSAPKGSESWCRWLHFEILRLLDDREQVGERLGRLVGAFEESTAFSKLTDRDGRPFIDFADYCQTPPPYGLGRPPVVVHEEAEIRAALPHGGDHTSAAFREQVTNGNLLVGGNRAKYTVARLKRDRPDLAARVEVGELSANAAAIEAGFRRKTMTVPADIDALAAALRQKLDPDQRCRLAALLVVVRP
jgi:hypothetical protein